MNKLTLAPIWINGPTYITSAGAHLYWHWLMDDMLGLWWLMKENNQIQENSSTYMNNTIILHQQVSKSAHHSMLEQVFSNNPIKLLSDWEAGKKHFYFNITFLYRR